MKQSVCYLAVNVWAYTTSAMHDWMSMNQWWNDDRGKPKYSQKTCPSTTLSTTNPTGTGLGFSPKMKVKGKLMLNKEPHRERHINQWKYSSMYSSLDTRSIFEILVHLTKHVAFMFDTNQNTPTGICVHSGSQIYMSSSRLLQSNSKCTQLTLTWTK